MISKIRMFGAAMALLLLFSVLNTVLASETSAGDTLPYETWLQTLQESLTGPVAFSVAVMGIVSCGATLIFMGGEIGRFMRSLIYIILVMTLLVGANSLMTRFFNGSLVAASAAEGAEFDFSVIGEANSSGKEQERVSGTELQEVIAAGAAPVFSAVGEVQAEKAAMDPAALESLLRLNLLSGLSSRAAGEQDAAAAGSSAAPAGRGIVQPEAGTEDSAAAGTAPGTELLARAGITLCLDGASSPSRNPGREELRRFLLEDNVTAA